MDFEHIYTLYRSDYRRYRKRSSILPFYGKSPLKDILIVDFGHWAMVSDIE